MRHLLFFVAVMCGVAIGQSPLGSAGEQFPWVVNNGAWCWYQDARAIYYKGTAEKTYIGFIDQQGNVKAWSYNHVTKQKAMSVLHVALEVDDHDVPSLFLRKDGRITAYYTRHSKDKFILYRTTVNPEDISSWQPEDTIVTTGVTSYTHEFQLKNENDRIYLFTRNQPPTGNLPNMIHSDDNGATWTNPVIMISSTDRPYVKYVSDGISKIHCAFGDGHPRVILTNSIYYACYEKGKFYKASGALIKDTSALPIKTGAAYEGDLVYNGATNGKSWIWDIATDDQNRPVMVFAVFPDSLNHHYYYARWTGTKWFVKDLVNSGKWFPQTLAGTREKEVNYSAGVSLDHDNPSIVYLSRNINSKFEIERWVTSDNGTTWTTTSITKGSADLNVRPLIPWTMPYGAKGPSNKLLFWMNGTYVHWSDYATGIKYCELPEQTAILPLPSAHQELFSSGQKGPIELFNVSGKKVFKEFGDQLEIRTADLPLGIYIMRKGTEVRMIQKFSNVKTVK